MHAEKITPEHKDFHTIKMLYMHSFPEEEILPYEFLYQNESSLYGFYDHGFCGFASFIRYEDLLNITFFAVTGTRRHQGYGSRILQIIHNHFPHHRITVDIESPLVPSENTRQRQQRLQFYLHNGFKVSEVRYIFNHVTYDVLVLGDAFTCEDYDAFWHHFYPSYHRVSPQIFK